MDLRVVAMITIFLGSAVGCSLSWKFLTKNKFRGVLIRMFSAGIILALAFVHVVAEAISELSEISDYPLGGTFVMIGVMLLLMIEHLSHHAWGHDHAHPPPQASADPNVVDPKQPIEADHAHSCLNNLSSSKLVEVKIRKTRVLALYLFEFACLFHSVVIGIALGVTTNRSTLINLIIALIFHQFLEGVSLGCVIAETPITSAKSIFMIVAYSSTTPLGIGMGMIINAFGDPESFESILIQGLCQGLAGGMLIYLALIQIIAEEFSKTSGLQSLWQKLAMHLALIGGALGMCIIAIWA